MDTVRLAGLECAQLGKFPFILTTVRVLEHYNCGTMTRRTGNARIVTEDALAIHPADAARKGIADGDTVLIFSARGEVRIHAKVFDEVKPGILYTTFHFPEHLVNVVTSSECDEDTMCPEYKVVAVDVERVSALVEKHTARPETVANPPFLDIKIGTDMIARHNPRLDL